MRTCQPFLQYADRLVDQIFLKEPRILGVGYVAYLLWILGQLSNLIRDYMLGFQVALCIYTYRPELSCLDFYIGGASILCFFTAWLGSVIIPDIKRTNSYPPAEPRNIYFKLKQITDLLVKNPKKFPYLSCKLLVFGLLIVNFLISAWIWLLFKHDPAMFLIVEKSSMGINERLILAIIAQTVSLASAVVFWNAAAIIFLHIIYSYYCFLSILNRSIKGEMVGLGRLALTELFMKIVDSDKPGLHFTIIWHQLQSPMDDLMNVLKRVIIAIIVSITIPYMSDILTGQTSVSAGTISGMFIGLGLSIPTLYLVHAVVRFGQLLRRLMIVELEDIKVEGTMRNDERVKYVAQEIEYLIERFGHPLVNTRDLIELLVAIVSLITVILTAVMNILTR